MTLSLLIFILIFLFFTGFEWLKFRWNFFSPVVLLGGPLLVMSCLTNLTIRWTGFIPVNSQAISIWITGLTCFWLGGMFISFAFHTPLYKNRNLNYLGNVPAKFLNYSCIVLILLLGYKLLTTLGSRSILDIENQEFAQNGMEAHVGGVLRIYLIFYIICLWEKKYIPKYGALFFCIVIFLLKMISGVRGDVVLPFIGALIYLLVKGYIKISIKTILLGFLFIFLLFILPTLFFKGDNTEDYFLYYFIFYCFAGVLGLSSYMDRIDVPWEINPDYLHTYFVNIYIKFFGNGEYLSLIQPDFLLVTTSASPYNFESNVYTLIGEVFINTGYASGCIYFFCFGVYTYLLFLLVDRGIILTILYSFVGACMVLGIFAQYVLTPVFYENQLFLILLYFLSKRNTIAVYPINSLINS